jgi:hypothetical protein
LIVSFHPDAEEEFHEAVNYYELCESGLGLDFAMEVNRTIQRILLLPAAWPVLEGEVRRCLTNRFPFGVLYSPLEDGVFILAVMHLHRDPDYWKDRA